jgi:hypothetical protein
MRGIATELERSAESIGLRAGTAVAEEIKNSAALSRGAAAHGSDEASTDGGDLRNQNWEARLKWIALGLAAGSLLFGMGLLVGARVL